MEDVTRNPQFWIFFGSRFVVFLILIQKKKQWFVKRGVKVLCAGAFECAHEWHNPPVHLPK